MFLRIASNAKVKGIKAVFKNISVLLFKFPFALTIYRHVALGFIWDAESCKRILKHITIRESPIIYKIIIFPEFK